MTEMGFYARTGTAGATGAAGAAGARGSRIYSGAGAPEVVPAASWTPNAVTYPAAAGDAYINTLTGEILVLT